MAIQCHTSLPSANREPTDDNPIPSRGSMALLPQASPEASQQLDACASAIRNELDELRRLYREDFLPRTIELGRLLSTARKLNPLQTSATLYRWALENTGLGDRSVRTYLQIYENRDRLQRLIDDTSKPPTSIDGCLALLRADNAEPTQEPTAEEAERDAAVRGAAAFAGAIERCDRTIREVDPQFLTTAEVEILAAAKRVAERVRTFARDGEVLPPITLGRIEPTAPLDRFGSVCRDLRATLPADLVARLDPHLVAIGEVLTTTTTDDDGDDTSEPTNTVVLTDDTEPLDLAEPETLTPSVGSSDLDLSRPLPEWGAEVLEQAKALHGSWSAVARASTNPNTGKPYSKQAISTAVKAAGLT